MFDRMRFGDERHVSVRWLVCEKSNQDGRMINRKGAVTDECRKTDYFSS